MVQLGEPAIAVHSADALSDAEVRDLMARTPVSVVVIAGPPWAGKTTLLATLYQEFIRAPIGAWSFAGSRSLLGFAVRAYWSDSASGASSPTTVRTNYDLTRPWLHLRLGRDGGLFDVVIADVSGEHFGPFRGGGPLGPVEPYFRRADHVVHLLDAALLKERRDRGRALTASQGLLRRFGESDMFAEGTKHTMVISKVDACDPEVVDSAEEQANGWLARWFPGSAVVRVAARPRTDEPPYGLEELLDAIMSVSRPTASQVVKPSLSRVGRRLFSRRTVLHPLTSEDHEEEGGAA